MAVLKKNRAMKAPVFHLGLALTLACELMLTTSSHAMPLYRWVDADGLAHYTTSATQLPKSLQKQAEELEVTVKEQDLGLEVAPDVSQTQQPATTRETRIEMLEKAIAKHEEALKAMISAPREPGSTALADDPNFQAIARELPALQANLEALQSQPSSQ